MTDLIKGHDCVGRETGLVYVFALDFFNFCITESSGSPTQEATGWMDGMPEKELWTFGQSHCTVASVVRIPQGTGKQAVITMDYSRLTGCHWSLVLNMSDEIACDSVLYDLASTSRNRQSQQRMVSILSPSPKISKSLPPHPKWRKNITLRTHQAVSTALSLVAGDILKQISNNKHFRMPQRLFAFAFAALLEPSSRSKIRTIMTGMSPHPAARSRNRRSACQWS